MNGKTVYRSPLYYDIAYGWDTTEELDLFSACFRTFGHVRDVRRVYEPGSGTGRLAIGFGRRGIEVTGLDRSLEMTAYAQNRAAGAGVRARVHFEHDTMESVPAGDPFDAAYCALSTFRYLATEDQVLAHLKSLGARLVPGAAYVVDTRFAEAVPRTPTHERWDMERDGIQVTSRWTFDPPAPPPGIGREGLSLEVTEHGETTTLVESNPSRLDTWGSFQRLVEWSDVFEVAACLGPSRNPKEILPAGTAEGRVVVVLRRR